MSVDRMSEAWGTPPWRVDAAVPARALPARAAIVVIGGGLTGLAAALALARRGAGVVLLEAETIGAGASGRTGAIALEHTAAGPLEGVNDCLPHLERLVHEEGIECALDRRGCRELTHVPRSEAAPDGDTHRVAWRDGDGDLVTARTVAGGTLDAGALLSGLARAALRAGAAIHEHAPVVGVLETTPLRVAVRVGGGEHVVAAEHVVVALNAYTRTLVPRARDLVPSLTTALATAALERDAIRALGLDDRLPFYTVDLPYLWGRLLADDRLVLGAGLAFDPDHRIDRLRITEGEGAAALLRLERRVRALHPALAAVPIERRWGGPIAFRDGRVPLLAHDPRSPNVIVAGGYAGHGVALGVRIGALVAAAIAGERPLPSWGAFGP